MADAQQFFTRAALAEVDREKALPTPDICG